MRQVQLFFCMVLGLLLVTLTSGTSLARELPIQSCVARLAAGQSAVSLAAQPEKFDCNLAHSVKGSGNFAVQLRFAPVQPVVDDPLVLRTASVWQDAELIRFRFADGSEQSLDFTSQTTSRYLTVGAIMEFPIPRHSAPLNAIIIETQGSANLHGAVQGAVILPRSEATLTKLLLVGLYAGFAGLALALFVYNLSLWAAMTLIQMRRS